MKVELINFRGYPEYQVVFPDRELTLLKGDTGIGKSTLLDAVQWCLFGGRDDVYPLGIQGTHANQTKVVLHLTELKMEGTDDYIIITRTKPPDNVHVFVPGYGALEGPQAQSYIARIFGTKNVWLASSYLKQEERCPLISLSNADKFTLLQEITFGCEVTQDVNSKDNPVWYLGKCDAGIIDRRNKTRTYTDQYNGILTLYNRQYDVGKQYLSAWGGGCPSPEALKALQTAMETTETAIGSNNQLIMDAKRIEGGNASVMVSISGYQSRLDTSLNTQKTIMDTIGTALIIAGINIDDPTLVTRLTTTADFVKLHSKIIAAKEVIGVNDIHEKFRDLYIDSNLTLESCHHQLGKYQQQLTIAASEIATAKQHGVTYTPVDVKTTIDTYQHQLSINDDLKAQHDTYTDYQRQLTAYHQDQNRRHTLQAQKDQLIVRLQTHQSSQPIDLQIVDATTYATYKADLQRGLNDKHRCESQGFVYSPLDIEKTITLIDASIVTFNTIALKEAEYKQYINSQTDYDHYCKQKDIDFEAQEAAARGYQALEDKLTLFCNPTEKASSDLNSHIRTQIESAKSIVSFNLQCPHCQGHLSFDTASQSLRGVQATADDIATAYRDIARLTTLQGIVQARDAAKHQYEVESNHYSHRYPIDTIRSPPTPVDKPEASPFNRQQITDFTTTVNHLKSIQWVDIPMLLTTVEKYTSVTQWVQTNNDLLSQLTLVDTTLNTLGPLIINPVEVSAPTGTVLTSQQCQHYHQIIAAISTFIFPDVTMATHKVKLCKDYIKYTEVIADIENLQRQAADLVGNIVELNHKSYDELSSLATKVKTCRYEIDLATSEISKLKERLAPVPETGELEVELINLQTEIKYQRSKYEGGKYLITLTESYNTLENIRKQITISTEEETDLITLRNLINDISTKALQDTVDCINVMTNDIIQHLFPVPISFELKLFKELKTQDRVKPQINLVINYKGKVYESIEKLSGGERDRISLGLTIALNKICGSPIIFLDECMAHLNAEMRQKCSKTVLIESGNKTVVNVCHEISEGYHTHTIKI
jgi:ABC-type lipoprotein export system ATPase subunit